MTTGYPLDSYPAYKKLLQNVWIACRLTMQWINHYPGSCHSDKLSVLMKNNMVENVAPSPAKRTRKPNFTPAECAVIFKKLKKT